MESKEKIVKTGRILIGIGIGTIVGFCVPYNEETVERFTIPLIIAVIAIVAGLFMVFITENKVKLMDSNEKIIKTGRILIGIGIGTIVGFCVPYNEETVERFTIPLIIAVIAIVAGLFMVFTINNKVKLEELQSSNHYKGANSCPVCGLPLMLDCQKCPKCHTNVK